MRTRILLCLTLLMVPLAVQAQTSDGTLYVKQFPGSDVGTKLAHAQEACPTGLTVPCLLVIDPSLAAFNPGTKPLLRSNVYVIDWRSGSPVYSQGTNTVVPVPILPTPPSLPPVTGTPFVLLNGASSTDCSVGGGAFTVFCMQTASGPIAIGGNIFPGVTSDGHSGLTVTNNLAAGTISASVNTRINVMKYGALGDCATNDTAAFAAAQTAAIAQGHGSVPVPIEIPQPPGGCYIVSNLTYEGVPLIGLPSSIHTESSSNNEPRVSIKSLPGQDILHIPDPTTTSGVISVFSGADIENINFIVDGSITNSFPNRLPGRSFDDAAMTSGSAVLSTQNGEVTCGDVGQAIQVNGAGTGGTNLVTTIASVYPCWASSPNAHAWQVITLAASAATTVSAGHAYIAVIGNPVTTTIGNCAIAADMADGKQADWVASSYNVSWYWKMANVTFNSQPTPGGNNDCGMFLQGGTLDYGLDIRNFAFYQLQFGVVEVSTVLNSSMTPGNGDYQTWEHGIFENDHVPWLTVNGLSNTLRDIQNGAQSGFQILSVGNSYSDYPVYWNIEIPQTECPSGCTAYGTHLTGFDHHVVRTEFSIGSSQMSYFDAAASVCELCQVEYTQINGWNNQIESVDNAQNGVTDGGRGNTILFDYNSSPLFSVPEYRTSLSNSPFKGSNNAHMARFTGDFAKDGNTATPYAQDDLILFPRDWIHSSSGVAYGTYVQPDSTSPTGYYFVMSPSNQFFQFEQFIGTQGTGNSLVVGTNLPQSGVTVYFSAKCPSAGTDYMKVELSGGTNPVVYGGGSCTTSYQTFKIDFPYGASGNQNGAFMIFQGNVGQTLDVAWIMIVPYKAALNGVTLPTNQVGQFFSGPVGTTASIGGSSLAAGACASGSTTVTGASSGMTVQTTPTTYPGAGFVWSSYVSSSNTVSTQVCAIVAGTPTASTYNVRVTQ